MGMFDFLSGIKKRDDSEHETKEVQNILIQESPRGSSGTQVFAGYFDEEYLETLKGKERAAIYDKMRRSDSQVKMLSLAVKNPIKTAAREIQAASDDSNHQKHAELCRQVMFRDIKFNKFLNECLGIIDFGHVFFEKVHQSFINKPIYDDDGNLVLSSYIGLKKLGWRSQKTIETFNFDANKEFCSITQQADGDLSSYVDIPREHLLFMVLDHEGDNLEGISMLRACYGNWFRKNTYLKLNGIGIEKSMPLPTAEIPVGQENSEQFNNLIKALRDFTTHQKNYLTYPAGWNINLSNGTNYDPSKAEQSIDNEDKRMAKAFLANFLELGMSGSGAYALSNDLSDFFLSGLMSIANVIKEEIDELLKELVILNFGEQDKYPTFEFSGIKDKAGEELAKILEMMTRNKIIIPDDRLEDHVRKRYGVSPKSDEGQRQVSNSPNVPGEESTGLSLSEKVEFAIQEKRKKMAE